MLRTILPRDKQPMIYGSTRNDLPFVMPPKRAKCVVVVVLEVGPERFHVCVST